MKRLINDFGICIVLLLVSSCSHPPAGPTQTIEPTVLMPTPTRTAAAKSCKPTLDDGVSPSYQPSAPERTVVGTGHIVTGVVLSSLDCQPIAHAKLEFWPEEAGRGHADSSRATFFSDENGLYRFECNPPEHIHMRISAEGHRTIGVNSYHPNGEAEGTFDIVLEPE